MCDVRESQAIVLVVETGVALSDLGMHIDTSADPSPDRMPALIRAAELAAVCRLHARVFRSVPVKKLEELRQALQEAGLPLIGAQKERKRGVANPHASGTT